MTLEQSLLDIAAKIAEQASRLDTEEATKHALVLPFIQALGYDVFDPNEVVPEFTADIAGRHGEKVDYAILHQGEPAILIECKKYGDGLRRDRADQLARYFMVTDAKLGILTNGMRYQFFSDLERANRMDERPFLELDLSSSVGSLALELTRFTKDAFDIDSIVDAAAHLRYTRAIKQAIAREWADPSDDFVRHFAVPVYPNKRMTRKVLEEFRIVVKRAVQTFIHDQANERLTATIRQEESEEDQEQQDIPGRPRHEVITTEEELQGYLIVKAILAGTVDLDRVTIRDHMSYCSVLLDDNARKLMCRLHFNSKKKFLGLFSEERREERFALESLNDIYQYGSRLRTAAERLER